MIDTILNSYMSEMLRHVPLSFKRYMYDRIHWESRMIGITGPRGVGKSTMILQRLSQTMDQIPSLYVSADHTYFSTHSLIQVIDDFVMNGGRAIYIDEVHKYKNWSRELKQAYDVHADLRIIYTGSSVLDILNGEADLSRRSLIYNMQGLSFREYLALRHGIVLQSMSLKDIIALKVSVPQLPHPLPLFRDYLKNGYYPFSTESGFEMRMEQIVNQTVEVDIPQYADMKASTARKLKKMLSIISTLVPYKPNMATLSVELGVSKNNVADYLTYLEKAGMIGQLRDETGGIRGLGKVEKVYLDNPNLAYTLSNGSPDIGNIRETFFYNQLRVDNDIISSSVSDFSIGDNVFEIGGKKKGHKQIDEAPGGLIVKDDIEYGHGIVIPLWHFGMNY